MSGRSNIPADFDPWHSVDALKGITEALVWQLTEGPASEAPLDRDTHASLIGLAYAARKLSHDLHAYFRAASEAGLELPPLSGIDKGVKEDRGPYAIN